MYHIIYIYIRATPALAKNAGLYDIVIYIYHIYWINIIYIYIPTNWWFQPPWKIWVRLDHHPNYWGKSKPSHVPNHQPAYIVLYSINFTIFLHYSSTIIPGLQHPQAFGPLHRPGARQQRHPHGRHIAAGARQVQRRGPAQGGPESHGTWCWDDGWGQK